jgi:hypothetical protein
MAIRTIPATSSTVAAGRLVRGRGIGPRLRTGARLEDVRQHDRVVQDLHHRDAERVGGQRDRNQGRYPHEVYVEA